MRWSKRLLRASLVVVSLLVAGSALAGSGGMSVSNVSVRVIPQAGLSAHNMAAWATNTAYTRGQLIAANGSPFLCISSGTSTNTGTGPAGYGDITDGTVTWRSALTDARHGFILYNLSTNVNTKAYVSIGSPAVVEQGSYLGPNGSHFAISGPGVPQAAVYVIVTNGPAIISSAEW
jgi:hypothetical protein